MGLEACLVGTGKFEKSHLHDAQGSGYVRSIRYLPDFIESTYGLDLNEVKSID